MAITAMDSGGSLYSPIEAGVYAAVCCGVVDIGTHFDKTFEKSSRKVVIMWELPHERINIEVDGVQKNIPRVVSREFTLSLHKKANLRGMLQSWRGRPFTDDEAKGFDVSKLIGVNCALNIIQETRNGKLYANVSAVTPLMKGTQPSNHEGKARYFSFEDGTEVPDDLPAWILTKIKSSDEYKAMTGHTVADGDGFAEFEAPNNMEKVPF